MTKNTIGFGSDLATIGERNKIEFDAPVIQVETKPDIIGFGLRKYIKITFSSSSPQNVELWSFLEQTYKKSPFVGIVSPSRFNFLPDTTGLYAMRVKMATNRFLVFSDTIQALVQEMNSLEEQVEQLDQAHEEIEQLGARLNELQEENKVLQGMLSGKKKGKGSDLQKRFQEVKKFMLPELQEVVEDRMREYNDGGERDAKVETYLRNVLGMPWGKYAKDPESSLSQIRKQLDDDHYGLNEPKEKILEFLAVKHFNSDNKSSIMCFLGPPGVGKTSLGQSLGKKGALNRPWVRVSMGGVHDEPTIRGHNYTYVGSSMGRIMQAIKQSGVMNPIILIDEIDKISENGANGNRA